MRLWYLIDVFFRMFPAFWCVCVFVEYGTHDVRQLGSTAKNGSNRPSNENARISSIECRRMRVSNLIFYYNLCTAEWILRVWMQVVDARYPLCMWEMVELALLSLIPVSMALSELSGTTHTARLLPLALSFGAPSGKDS